MRGRFRIIRHLFGTWKTKCYESDNTVQFMIQRQKKEVRFIFQKTNYQNEVRLIWGQTAVLWGNTDICVSPVETFVC